MSCCTKPEGTDGVNCSMMVVKLHRVCEIANTLQTALRSLAHVSPWPPVTDQWTKYVIGLCACYDILHCHHWLGWPHLHCSSPSSNSAMRGQTWVFRSRLSSHGRIGGRWTALYLHDNMFSYHIYIQIQLCLTWKNWRTPCIIQVPSWEGWQHSSIADSLHACSVELASPLRSLLRYPYWRWVQTWLG